MSTPKKTRGRPRKQPVATAGEPAVAEEGYEQNIVEEIENTTTDSTVGKFRLAQKRILLGYATQIEKTLLLNHLQALGGETITCLIAHETGKKTGVDYPHTHVAVEYKKPINTQNARFFDIKVGEKNLHPHIRKVRPTDEDWFRVCAYVCKEDKELLEKRFQYTLKSKTLSDQINSFDTEADMLNALCRKPSDAPGLVLLWQKLHINKVTPGKEWIPHGWANTIEQRLKKEKDEDDRSVIWIFDKFGRSGKSQFVRGYQRKYGKASVIKFGGLSRAQDMAYLFVQEITKFPKARVLLVDLPRQQQTYEGMYALFEGICNGCITSGKYQSSTIDFNPIQIVITANFLPNVNQMTMDRWEIYEIRPCVNGAPKECTKYPDWLVQRLKDPSYREVLENPSLDAGIPKPDKGEAEQTAKYDTRHIWVPDSAKTATEERADNLAEPEEEEVVQRQDGAIKSEKDDRDFLAEDLLDLIDSLPEKKEKTKTVA